MRFAKFYICLAVLPLSLAATEIETSFRGFGLIEQGPVTSAAVAGLGIDIHWLIPTEPGYIDLRVGIFSGSFIGESLGISAGLAYRFPITENWQPILGLSYTLDYGSRIISSFALDTIPETPLSYLGLSLELLSFQVGKVRWSLLGASLSLGLCAGPPIIRTEIDLLRLGIGANTETTDPSQFSGRPWLSLSYGLDYSLLGYGLQGFRPLSAAIAMRVGSLEFEGCYTVISDNPTHYAQSWAYSISVLIAPQFGVWHPAIGLGFFHANPDYLVNGEPLSLIKKGSFESWQVVVKLLRFNFGLRDGLALQVSLGDLRFGSIFPNWLQSIGTSGSLSLMVDIFRIGLNFQI